MGQILKDLSELENIGHKGDWCFINDDTYICIKYGDDNFNDIAIIPVSENIDKKPYWDWDGNKDAPTLYNKHGGTDSVRIFIHQKDGSETNLAHFHFKSGKLIDC